MFSHSHPYAHVPTRFHPHTAKAFVLYLAGSCEKVLRRGCNMTEVVLRRITRAAVHQGA